MWPFQVVVVAPAGTLTARPDAARPLNPHQARAELATRLRACWGDVEQAALERLYGISPPDGLPGPEYADGLRVAASAALEFLLAGVTCNETRPLQPPPAVQAQARLAARNGVSLDVVLRRCLAGYTVFGDFVMREAEEGELLQGVGLRQLLRAQSALFDRLILSVAEEHTREAECQLKSVEEHRVAIVRGLLAGEQLDAAGLDYDIDAHHVGVIAKGKAAPELLRGLARTLDRNVLLVHSDEGLVWAWLGGRHAIDRDDLDRLASSTVPAQVCMAMGEPAEGLRGWRLTHQQAKAAFPVALRDSKKLVRYADVVLLSSILQDHVLAASLHSLYLEPLSRDRDGGSAARQTLRAYFAADRNISSAAAALGVSRRTVSNRINAIEERLGRSLTVAAAEIEAALRLDSLSAVP